MRLGFGLPQIGSWAGPDALSTVATQAERLGYDSLWVLERTLAPVEPRVRYAIGDGTLPVALRTVLDPLETLTFVAAQTSRIALGTSVLNLVWYSPVLLARRLTTIDVLSRGRLKVSLGLGWSPEEYEVAGVPWADRGRRFEEALQALKTIWTTDPVEFHGDFYSIPRSFIGPKPVQKPHPPIYIAGFTPAAMARVARHADGWNPANLSPAAIAERFARIKTLAEEAGRDPGSLELVVRANVRLHDQPLADDRVGFTGSLEQVADDIAATREIGASELLFDVSLDPGVTSLADVLERMALLFERRPRPGSDSLAAVDG